LRSGLRSGLRDETQFVLRIVRRRRELLVDGGERPQYDHAIDHRPWRCSIAVGLN
jgi:hypothetical protein